MMVDKTLIALNAYMRRRDDTVIDMRAQLVVAVLYLVAVITVPVTQPSRLLWMLAYPIIMAEALGVGYGRLLRRSLWVMPFIILIAIFNPIIDRQPMLYLWDVEISRGWVTFVSIVLRAVLSVQALLLLVSSGGFSGICRAMASLGVPDVLVTQLMMLFRYLSVLLGEAQTMHRSRLSRGFGRKSYPLTMWGTFVGQLLMRSIGRASRISRAMTARGFDGDFFAGTIMPRLAAKDWIYMAVWILVFFILRFINLSGVVMRYI